MKHLGFRVILKRMTAIRFMLKDKSVPLTKKLLIVAGIIYIFVPTDLLPFVIFPVAWMDDLCLWLLILWLLRHELDKYWNGEKNVDFSGKYHGKSVIDDVEYEVRDTEKNDDEE